MVYEIYMYASPSENRVFEHAQNATIQIHPMHAQSHPGMFSPLMRSIVFNDSVTGQRIRVV